MKNAVGIIFIYLLFCASSYANEFNIPIRVLDNNKDIVLLKVTNKIQGLRQKISSKRRDFEALKNYKERVSSARSELLDYLKMTYLIRLPADSVTFDWENSIVTIRKELPLNVLRTRGGNSSSREVAIITAVPQKLGRQIVSMQELIEISMTFQLDENLNMESLSSNVSFLNEVIYED